MWLFVLGVGILVIFGLVWALQLIFLTLGSGLQPQQDAPLFFTHATNAQIGKNTNRKFSLHNFSNRNGEHWTDFMLENRLTCLNTEFQKRKGKLWTYTHTNNTEAQIDYAFINKKWCILQSPNCHSKDTTEPMKESTLNNNYTLWLVPA